MSRKPWMKWYPADWRSEPKLRMCGLAARGLWADMLTLMHEAEPYGHLLVNATAPSPKQLALLVGASERDCRTLVAELREAGVFSETADGVIYSRRMVRDEIKATQDRENGKGGGNPKLRETDNGGVNPPDKAQRLEARDQKPEKKTRARGALSLEQQAEFDSWWPHYPHKAGKAEAMPAFAEARRKATLEELIEGAKRYGLVLAKPNAPSPKFPQGWLNGERWRDEIANPSPSPSAAPRLSDDEIRIGRLERLIATVSPDNPQGIWRSHHGPAPSLDEARAELAHLIAKRDGRAAA